MPTLEFGRQRMQARQRARRLGLARDGRRGILQARQRGAQEGDQLVEQAFGAHRIALVGAPHRIEHVEQELRVDARLHRLQLPVGQPTPRFALRRLGRIEALGGDPRARGCAAGA